MDPRLAEGKAPGIYLLTFPEPPDVSFGDDDINEADVAQTPDPLVQWVERAFADGYSSYERVVGPKLDPRYGSPTALPIEKLPFPSLTVGIEAEWRPKTNHMQSGGAPRSTKDTKKRKKEYIEFEEVFFDGDLLVTLLEMYILDGWQPIAEIGEQLAVKLDKLRKSRQSPSGGTPEPTKEERELELWDPAAMLFHLARNGVGLLVRREIAWIETMAGLQIDSHVAKSREQFSQLPLTDLTDKSVWKKVVTRTVRDREGDEAEIYRFTLVDQKLAEDLSTALDEPVRCLRLLDLTLKELARLPQPPPEDEGGTGSGPGGGPGGGGPGGGAGGGQTGARRSLNDAVARALAAARQFADASKKLADASKTDSKQQLLFLVLPALMPGFSTSDMEEKLSAAVGEITTQFFCAHRSDPSRSPTHPEH